MEKRSFAVTPARVLIGLVLVGSVAVLAYQTTVKGSLFLPDGMTDMSDGGTSSSGVVYRVCRKTDSKHSCTDAPFCTYEENNQLYGAEFGSLGGPEGCLAYAEYLDKSLWYMCHTDDNNDQVPDEGTKKCRQESCYDYEVANDPERAFATEGECITDMSGSSSGQNNEEPLQMFEPTAASAANPLLFSDFEVENAEPPVIIFDPTVGSSSSVSASSGF